MPAVRMGIDENGLGPRLGPLVVTAVVARVTDAGDRTASRKPRGALATRLGDSKALIRHNDVALGEAWARALLARRGDAAPHPDALVDALMLRPRGELRSLCPTHVEAQCWRADGERFEADDDLLATVRRDLERLADKGIDVIDVVSDVICTHRLNRARAEGRSRFDVDLHAMEGLILAARERVGEELCAVCGKVGGYARYSSAFGPLAGRLHAVIEEGAARSTYRFPGLGTIAFTRDADASDLLVGMASMVGKWLREILMARIVRFYAADGVPVTASGYHDPVTERFVRATSLLRQTRDVPSSCFERAPQVGGERAPQVGGEGASSPTTSEFNAVHD